MPTVTEYIQYRWLPRTARGIDVVSRKLIPVVADALATFGVSSVVAAKAIGEQGWMDGSLSITSALTPGYFDLPAGSSAGHGAALAAGAVAAVRAVFDLRRS